MVIRKDGGSRAGDVALNIHNSLKFKPIATSNNIEQV